MVYEGTKTQPSFFFCLIQDIGQRERVMTDDVCQESSSKYGGPSTYSDLISDGAESYLGPRLQRSIAFQ